MRLIKKTAIALAILTFAGAAHADPISMAAVLGPILGSALGGTIASAVAWVGANAAFVAALGATVYGSVAQRRKAKNQAADARRAYNSQLEDRSTTVISTIPPWQIVYGRATLSGSIHAMFTSDKVGYRSDGEQYTKADALHHLVYVFAAHECATVHDVKIGGKSCGPFDATGWSLNSDYTINESSAIRNVTLAPGGTLVEQGPIEVQSSIYQVSSGASGENGYDAVWANASYTLSGDEKTLTNTSGFASVVSYTRERYDSSLLVRLHMGASTQTVDAYLNGLFPTKWTANHRIRGRMYAVVTVDVEDTQFQSGPPNLQLDLTGKLVYDPRNASTTGSSNPALCVRDFLTAKWGAEASAGELNDTIGNAAANACDVSISTKVSSYVDNTLYSFAATVESWTGNSASLSIVGGALRVLATGKDASIQRTGLSISGSANRYLRVRIKRLDGLGWRGRAKYTTAGHSFSTDYHKEISGGAAIGGAYQTLIFDMHDLTQGGGDWKNSTITGVRFEFGDTKYDDWDIDWVAFSSFTETTVTGPKYTLNGMFRTDQSREGILDQMSLAMSGFTSYSGGTWLINAGAWTAAIKDFGDADLNGQIEILQGDVGMDELANAAKGTYFPEGSASPIDFEPYKNTSLITADGEELWEDIALPFTNTEARARSISRISVERLRSGQVIRIPLQLQAWPVQVGDRIRVTSAEYGFSLKTYRITDWNFDTASPVVLVAQEDAASIYDEVDTTLSDPTPNTNLPSPAKVPDVENLAAASGTAHLIRMVDGRIMARISVSWTLSKDRYVSSGTAYVEVTWSRVGKENANSTHTIRVPASSSSTYIEDVRDGEYIQISARYQNNAGRRGKWSQLSHVVVGKTAAPSNVTSLTRTFVEGGVMLRWAQNTEVDYSSTELRQGGSDWNTATALTGSTLRITGTEYYWKILTLGTYTVRARHRDTTGHYSAADAMVSVAVAAPSNVSGFTYLFTSGGVLLRWTQSTDLNYDSTELRQGGSGWSTATPLTGTTLRIKGSEYLWVWPTTGATYTIRAKHRDIVGNYSVTETNLAVTITEADLALLPWQFSMGDIGGGNLLVNSSFEVESVTTGQPLYWGQTAFGSNITITWGRSSTVRTHGRYSLRFNVTGFTGTPTSNVHVVRQTLSLDTLPQVIPGRKYVLSAMFMAGSVNYDPHMQIDWLDAAGTSVSGGFYDVSINASTISANTWQRVFSDDYTAPAGAAYAQISLGFTRPSASDSTLSYMAIDAAMFQDGSTVTGYWPKDSTDSDLLPGSATEVVSAYDASESWTGTITGIGNFHDLNVCACSFTNTGTRTVTVFVEGSQENLLTVNSGGQAEGVNIFWLGSSDMTLPVVQDEVIWRRVSVGGTSRWNFSLGWEVQVPPGKSFSVYLTYEVMSVGNSTNVTMTATVSRVRILVLKTS